MTLTDSVGERGKNNANDVRAVQSLLVENSDYLVPSRIPPPSGVCDAQTIALIKLFQERVVHLSPPSGLIAPQSPTWFALNRQSGPGSDPLQSAISELESEFLNFAQRFIKDANVRANYLAEARRFSQELLDDVKAGRLTPTAAAARANEMRNSLMEAMRVRSSDIGRAVAELEKATGKTLADLMEKYALKIYGKEFKLLSAAEQDIVYLEIVAKAGAPNPKWNARALKLGKIGRGLIVVSLALAVYNVASSERPGRQVVKEGVTAGAGLLGSMAGGAAAGLVCGPGAPVCVGIGVVVGGIAFGLGADLSFDWLWK